MGAEVEAQAQVQSQGGIAGEAQGVGDQGAEIPVADPGADAGDTAVGQAGARQQGAAVTALALRHINEDEDVLGRRA